MNVVAVQGLALIQDAGRPGRMHEGVPPGGALVPELLAAANAAVGNPPGAAAIEHYGRVVIGDRAFAPAGRVGYIAVAGGLDAPVVLGGRGALLAAGIGRPLRAGDVLPDRPLGAATELAPGGAIRVVAGPDLDRVDGDAFFDAEYRITPVGDRAGFRLDGPAIPVATALGPSAPMVRGAIQVPPSGQPIVLGPDHPTTGGYPVVAVIVQADFGRFAVRPPGATVRFTRTGPGSSR
jgi:allophanate hydrolase subunit 2